MPEKKTRGRKKKEDSAQQTQSAAEVEKKKPGRKKATGKAETDASSVQPKRIKVKRKFFIFSNFVIIISFGFRHQRSPMMLSHTSFMPLFPASSQLILPFLRGMY